MVNTTFDIALEYEILTRGWAKPRKDLGGRNASHLKAGRKSTRLSRASSQLSGVSTWRPSTSFCLGWGEGAAVERLHMNMSYAN